MAKTKVELVDIERRHPLRKKAFSLDEAYC